MNKVIIWDIDGTLLNTLPGLTSAYQYTIERLGLAQKSDQEIRSYIGPTPVTVFMERFGLNQKDTQFAADIFRDRYKNHDLLKAEMFPQMDVVLKTIQQQGILQAIATNKRQDYALDICKHFGIDKYCYPIYGADNFNQLKKVDLIKKCMHKLGTTTAVMIGDTNGDKSAAEQAGIDFIGVNYGFGFKNINHYANSPIDILKILKIEL